ncbi:glycosyl hydrolase family 18 protein [Noviherbaspirillum saxi]|uniref:chitinase n=1 Tax=Noviherbaspirillum saxi TaxID=2320863 RepID=A0A3A3G2Y2_9BURK|nr:glycosyl hydrolase family 18 protein [Noviherbaspirillum saxi]RJF92423.1 hypothetical protein D3871_27795 [Noviherbaspirillum saxi]
MLLSLLRRALFVALLLTQATASAEAPKAWAYFAWWLPDSWRTASLDQLKRLLFFEISVNGNGDISERNGWPDKFGELRQAVKRQGVALDLTLTLFDPKSFDNLFTSAEATRRLLENATALASHKDVAGLQLDFEIYAPVRPETRANYRAFVQELSKRLHAQSPARALSVFLPMGDESLLYDAPTLAVVDHVVLQGYDSHWVGSKAAGPVAPLRGDEVVTWEKAVSKATGLGVPKKSMYVGFPLYGYEWQVKGLKQRSPTIAKGVTTSFSPIAPGLVPAIQVNVQNRVQQYGSYHDPVSASTQYHFKAANGQYFEGWFEDWWSLDRKTDYLVQEQLAGIVFFILGYDNDQLVEHFLRRTTPRRGQKPQ